MKLDGALATIEQDGERLLCGGGARLPQAAARAARAGLSGLEFGVNIPGTVGGAVKMNANAYGGDLVARARVGRGRHARAAPSGARPTSSASATGARTWVRTRSSRGRRSRSRRAEPEGVKATLAEMRAARKAAQPSGHQDLRLHLQEPRRRARRGAQRRRAARRGRLPRAAGGRRALLREARQLRREHGRGDHRRRDRADGRGPQARARALRRRARARGAVPGRCGRLGAVGRAREHRHRRGPPADLPAAGRPAGARADVPAPAPPAGRARARQPRCSPPATSSGCATPRWSRSSRCRSRASRRRTPASVRAALDRAAPHDDHPPRRPRAPRASRGGLSRSCASSRCSPTSRTACASG